MIRVRVAGIQYCFFLYPVLALPMSRIRLRHKMNPYDVPAWLICGRVVVGGAKCG